MISLNETLSLYICSFVFHALNTKKRRKPSKRTEKKSMKGLLNKKLQRKIRKSTMKVFLILGREAIVGVIEGSSLSHTSHAETH